MAVVASKLAVARQRPSGDQATQRMVRVCASSRIAAQLHASLPGCWRAHIRTALSPLQLASSSPARLAHSALQQCWPKSCRCCLPQKTARHSVQRCQTTGVIRQKALHFDCCNWKCHSAMSSMGMVFQASLKTLFPASLKTPETQVCSVTQHVPSMQGLPGHSSF